MVIAGYSFTIPLNAFSIEGVIISLILATFRNTVLRVSRNSIP